MARAEQILAAVQSIHEAPLEQNGWTHALAAMAATVSCGVAALRTENAASLATEFIAGSGIAPEHLAAMSTLDFAYIVPGWYKTLPAGVVAPTSALEPERQFARSFFYNEVVR